ncbi:LysR family transcriptional regulator [Aestuariirhabdus sp. Z084]|uniref:LysR family transcriptional regulator n=1 Tax=Aestuariirhabdus haliotis TaxID=2918751 RepID=UPI00201B423E|nr:LysR family transcriptional regulator [Aestuariirhabdus haliotis]MCL6415016.1 LysR family transcriptional regulator [Aestuariirhabdus haliotis]MCL6418948.1 LysR family transcriptional regulator [Aestuariirhabdus haliotis]
MNTSDLELFVRIADSGSISASAEQLGITSAAASAALKRLEKQLMVQLFIRSTRQLRITAEGERFLVYSRQALGALEEGRSSLDAMRGKIGGELRMSVSSDLGRNIVLPWLDQAMDEHPDLVLKLSVGDAVSDFYMERVDVALRYGELEDSSLVAFQIAEVERVLFAAPEYLQAHGEPQHPEELRQHNCLTYRLGSRVFNTWSFADSSKTYRVTVQGDRESNDADIVRRWVVAGKGIGFKSSLDISADLRSGRVVRILEQYQSDPVGIWLICPSRKQVTPAVLMLRDLLRKRCAEALDGAG